MCVRPLLARDGDIGLGVRPQEDDGEARFAQQFRGDAAEEPVTAGRY